MPTCLTVAVLAAAAIAVGSLSAVGAAATPSPVESAKATTPTTTTITTSPISVQVGPTTVGRRIAPGFLGFSIEYRAVRAYTGTNPNAINPVLVQLIRNLNLHQSPILRIGGNSADQTWWPLRGVKISPSIKLTLNRSWLATTRALAVDTGGKLILDLNLKLDSAAEMKAESNVFRTDIGTRYIDALEIGNEPELYPVAPWYYREPGHIPSFSRPRSYNPAAYLREMSSFARLLKGFATAGPATGSARYLAQLPKLLKAEPKLKVVTYHRYPLIRCFSKPGDAGYPTIANLLKPSSSRSLLNGVQPDIALAHAHGDTFRMDELNSVACKGAPGVSNTFASALWILDSLFAVARSGVDGVNIHTLPEAIYSPFSFERTDGRWTASVKPEYYGLLLFTEAAPPGSRLLSVAAPASPDIRARAAVTPTGLIHAVLINDSLTTDHTITLRAPSGTGNTAVIERLTAPGGASATDGVTLAGQSFGAETTTGTLTGPFSASHLTPTNGQYTIQLPASSAAMVSFAPAKRPASALGKPQ